MFVYLENYSNPVVKHCFDENDFLSSQLPRLVHSENQQTSKLQGYYSERNIGLIHFVRCVVCLYTDGKVIKMALLGKVYELSKPDIKAEIQISFPFAKRFVLFGDGQILISFRYWFYETNDYWPEGDIFRLVERITDNIESKRRFLHIWNEQSDAEGMAK